MIWRSLHWFSAHWGRVTVLSGYFSVTFTIFSDVYFRFFTGSQCFFPINTSVENRPGKPAIQFVLALFSYVDSKLVAELRKQTPTI